MEEELAEAKVQLKLCNISLAEKDNEIQELTKQVLLLQKESNTQKEQLETLSWKPALLLLQVPSKVVSLLQTLEEEPYRIIEIQKEWEHFVIWRYDLLQQIAQFTTTSEKDDHQRSTVVVDGVISSPLEIVAHQFATIDQLGLKLRDKLWDIILNCINQTKVPMSVLTDCLSIIVQTDEKTESEHEQVIRSAMYQIHCTGEDGLIRFETMKDRCESTLSDAIAKQCKETMKSITARSRRQSEFIEADGQLLKTLYVVGDLLVSAFPMGYQMDDFFTSVILDQLTRQLKELSESAASMDIYTTFRIVNWIAVSQRDAMALGMDRLVSCFDEADELFTNAYLVVIQKQVRDASDQLVRHSYTPKRSTDGYLYTDVVEELVGYVVQQVKFLQTYLSGIRLREAVHLCATIFQARQQYQHDDLISINNSNLENLPNGYIEHVCAVVNDNYRIQSDMMEVYVTCESKLDSSERELLQNFLHEVSLGFESVVEEAIRAITLIIFRDLTETFYTLFSDRWLVGTAKPILTMLSTFDDYLEDIEKWLKQSFHVRDIRDSCIDRLVRQYIERLYEPDVEFRQDEMKRLADMILSDAESVQVYCRKHRDTQQPESNVETSKTMKSTTILELVASFFTSSNPTFLFPEMAKELGNSVGPVIGRLLKYRLDLTSEEAQQLRLDLKEWELWAQHNAPSYTRFNIARAIEPAGPDTRVQKAQKMIGKGIEKGLEKAKAKRTSIVKGVQGVHLPIKPPFRRRSKEPK